MGEEFTSLLEEYLDEDMIRMKREEDEALLGSESEKEGNTPHHLELKIRFR